MVGAPNIQINFFTNALATCVASVLVDSMAQEYFVDWHWIVSIYKFPLPVLVNGPTMSIAIFSKA